MNLRRLLLLAICSFFSGLIPTVSNAQDNTMTQVMVHAGDTIRSDSTKLIENAPLDIGQNRGLFILTPDGNMQLRILGSVRYLVVFDGLNLPTKNGFSTYEIPTGDANQLLPNYYNGLEQTRLGFEVTRKTTDGDIFIRLETDFAGANGFRIRHAYGQYKRFLFGQTWSLFSHINALPAMVDFAGPTSSLVTRTPQIRFTLPKAIGQFNLAIGFEYIIPNLNLPDSAVSETFQLVPDFTVRLDRTFEWGAVQFSGILPVLSGRDSNGNLGTKTGWGLSSSVIINSWKNGKWYIQGVMGKSITRYFNDLSSAGLDLLLSPDGIIQSPLTTGYYVSYEHTWHEKVYSNFTYGLLHIQQYNFTEDAAYRKGRSVRMNTFWDIAEGAKIGLETILGSRVDRNSLNGDALRLNVLFYYDF